MLSRRILQVICSHLVIATLVSACTAAQPDEGAQGVEVGTSEPQDCPPYTIRLPVIRSGALGASSSNPGECVPVSSGAPIWGRLANPGWQNQPVFSTLFFTGSVKDGTCAYASLEQGNCNPPPNTAKYTEHPLN